jgi:small subunit ribosomal protein S9
MPRKKKETAKTKEKVETKTKTKKEVPAKKEKGSKEFFYGTGSRKESVARIRLYLKKGDILVNDKLISEYFPGPVARKVYEEPLRVVNRLGQISGTVKVTGGGKQGQLDAVAHGMSRALVMFDESFRPILSRKKLLTRDSREKERRKYGHAGKARKMKQSPKR